MCFRSPVQGTNELFDLRVGSHWRLCSAWDGGDADLRVHVFGIAISVCSPVMRVCRTMGGSLKRPMLGVECEIELLVFQSSTLRQA